MDISALTEQRRDMVINLLKGMKIRKSDGEGFDKDDVYACMQQLCDVYERSIDDLTVSYETEISELQDKYQKYDENNDLYISLIMEAKKSSNEIINKAKAEVDEILAAGKEQIAAQQEEIEACRAQAAKEKEDLEADLEAAKAAAEREKNELAAGIDAEKRHADAVRDQYRDQVAVMDQEFDEIKTNILRTAGKIDGLKAQLQESSEEAAWQLQDEQVPAEPEPAEEEAVEEAPQEMTFEELVAKMQQEDAAKAGPAEVEAPAEPPVVEPEIEVPAEPEPEESGFHFEPVFDTPAAVVEEPAEPEVIVADEPAIDIPVEEPAVEIPVEIPEVEIPVEEVPAEIPAVEVPEVEIPAEVAEFAPLEEVPAEIPVEVPVDDVIPQEVVPEVPEVEVPAVDTVEEAAGEVLGDIEDLALEDISVDIPQEEPVIEEEPIEEISFEGLEELFKD